MTKRQSSSTIPRLHWLPRLALLLFGSAHILTAGLVTQPTSAFGQNERGEAMLIEIWMEGDDLVLTRQVPQIRPSGWESDEEVARTMVEIAQQRYREGDQTAAVWLAQWARQLTNGRIGTDEIARFTEVSASAGLPPSQRTISSSSFQSPLISIQPARSTRN